MKDGVAAFFVGATPFQSAEFFLHSAGQPHEYLQHKQGICCASSLSSFPSLSLFLYIYIYLYMS